MVICRINVLDPEERITKELCLVPMTPGLLEGGKRRQGQTCKIVL